MALTRTTASGMSVADTEVLLASIADLQVSHNIAIDGEVMRVLSVPLVATAPVRVLRGIRGTAVAAHPSGASATFGPPADFGGARTQRRDVISISANGAIPNPSPGTDRIVLLNGTTALTTLTLTNPGKDADGDMLILVSNGKAAHAVLYATGLGGSGTTADNITFSAVALMSVAFVAANEQWVLMSGSSGTGAVAASPIIL
jgi:hypothetical protein